MKPAKADIKLRVTAELKRWLEEQAIKDDRTLSSYVRRVLESHREFKEMKK